VAHSAYGSLALSTDKRVAAFAATLVTISERHAVERHFLLTTFFKKKVVE
jgi:hypothetical protein